MYTVLLIYYVLGLMIEYGDHHDITQLIGESSDSLETPHDSDRQLYR
jgi:hypothetical protein